jgi:hypothetical protein
MQAFTDWMGALEARHLSNLTFQEVSRSLRALSSVYVDRRRQLAGGAALSGRGKRAAFALFYGPLHFLLVRHIVEALDFPLRSDTLVDLGCGTGTSGAAWATAVSQQRPLMLGVDRHPWAVEEAAHTYRAFGLRARPKMDDAARAAIRPGSAVLAAFFVNELDAASRSALLPRLCAHAERGASVLVVEPVARAVAPWWTAWRTAFEGLGGRSDEWRIRGTLPPLVEKLDRAAGLDHRELTARSLSM